MRDLSASVSMGARRKLKEEWPGDGSQVGAMSERRDGVERVDGANDPGSRKVMVSYQRMWSLAPERLQRSTRLVQQPRRTCWESITSSRAGWG